jgi:hypothetical protein
MATEAEDTTMATEAEDTTPLADAAVEESAPAADKKRKRSLADNLQDSLAPAAVSGGRVRKSAATFTIGGIQYEPMLRLCAFARVDFERRIPPPPSLPPRVFFFLAQSKAAFSSSIPAFPLHSPLLPLPPPPPIETKEEKSIVIPSGKGTSLEDLGLEESVSEMRVCCPT